MHFFKCPAVFPRDAYGFWMKNFVPPALRILSLMLHSSVCFAGPAGGDDGLVPCP